MKSKLSVALIGGAVLLLGACSATPQQTQQPAPTAGNDFTRSLAQYYREMTVNQFNGQADYWSGSTVFEQKAARSARGELVMPETPGQGTMRQPVKMGAELNDARSRLVGALNGGASTRTPQAAARAQASYDCWLDEASDPILSVEGPWLEAKVRNCRDSFETAMNEVNAALRTSQAGQPAGSQLAQAPTPAPAPAARTAPEQSFLVFFDFDKSLITTEAEGVLRRAAANAKEGGSSRINVTGHADRSGTDAYNLNLSQRRADAVRSFLIREGVANNQIQTAARGESQPLVPTADGVREPQNRRVEINIDRRVAAQ